MVSPGDDVRHLASRTVCAGDKFISKEGAAYEVLRVTGAYCTVKRIPGEGGDGTASRRPQFVSKIRNSIGNTYRWRIESILNTHMKRIPQ
jgi:hypothetical protein